MPLTPKKDHIPPRSFSQRLNELLDKLSRWLKAAVSLEQPLSPNDVDAIVLEERVLYSGTPMPVDAQESGGEANVNPDGMGTPIPDDIWAYIESLNPSAEGMAGSVQQQDENAAETALGSLVPEEIATEPPDQSTTTSPINVDSDVGSSAAEDLDPSDRSAVSEDFSATAEGILSQALSLQADISAVEGLSSNLEASALILESPSSDGNSDTATDSSDNDSAPELAYGMPWQFASSQPNLIEPYQVLGAAEQQLSSLSNRLSDMEWDRSPAVQLVPGYDSYLTGETVGGRSRNRGSTRHGSFRVAPLQQMHRSWGHSGEQ